MSYGLNTTPPPAGTNLPSHETKNNPAKGMRFVRSQSFSAGKPEALMHTRSVTPVSQSNTDSPSRKRPYALGTEHPDLRKHNDPPSKKHYTSETKSSESCPGSSKHNRPAHITGQKEAPRKSAATKLMTKCYADCVDCIKAKDFEGGRNALHPLTLVYTQKWYEDPDTIIQKNDFTKDEEQQLDQLCDISSALQFIGTYHSTFEQSARWISDLPENYKSHNFPRHDLTKCMMFIQAYLLNPIFATGNKQDEERQILAAHKHLIWLLDSQQLDVTLHPMWLDNYLNVCKKMSLIDPSCMKQSEQKFFEASQTTMENMKEAMNGEQAMNILDEHIDWLREQGFSRYSLISMACCAEAFDKQYIEQKDENAQLENLSNTYFYAGTLMSLGCHNVLFRSLCSTLENIKSLNISLKDYPELLLPLLTTAHSTKDHNDYS